MWARWGLLTLIHCQRRINRLYVSITLYFSLSLKTSGTKLVVGWRRMIQTYIFVRFFIFLTAFLSNIFFFCLTCRLKNVGYTIYISNINETCGLYLKKFPRCSPGFPTSGRRTTSTLWRPRSAPSGPRASSSHPRSWSGSPSARAPGSPWSRRRRFLWRRWRGPAAGRSLSFVGWRGWTYWRAPRRPPLTRPPAVAGSSWPWPPRWWPLPARRGAPTTPPLIQVGIWRILLGEGKDFRFSGALLVVTTLKQKR